MQKDIGSISRIEIIASISALVELEVYGKAALNFIWLLLERIQPKPDLIEGVCEWQIDASVQKCRLFWGELERRLYNFISCSWYRGKFIAFLMRAISVFRICLVGSNKNQF